MDMQPVSERKPFFSEEAYKNYSLTYYEYMEKILGKDVNCIEIPDDCCKPFLWENENASSNEQKVISSQSANKFSSLTQMEHCTYLRLKKKFKNIPGYKLASTLYLEDLRLLGELSGRVSLEYSEFCEYLKDFANNEGKRAYLTLGPDAKLFTKALLTAELNAFCQQCPKYYCTYKTIPLLASEIQLKEDISLTFIKNILKLGQISEIKIPCCKDIIFQENCIKLEQHFLLNEIGSEDAHPSKQNIIKDPIAADLSKKYEADIIITVKGLTTLVDNLYPNLGQSWEIPVMVITDSFKSNGKISKRIFVENPIPSKDMSVRERNLLFHEYVTKVTFTQSNAGMVRKQSEDKVGTNVNGITNVDHITSQEVEAFDDTFGNTIEDAIKYDSFGICSIVKQQSSNHLKINKIDNIDRLPGVVEIQKNSMSSSISTSVNDVKILVSESEILCNLPTIENAVNSSCGKLCVENSYTSPDLQTTTTDDDDDDDDDQMNDLLSATFLKVKGTVIECDKKLQAEENPKNKFCNSESCDDNFNESVCPSAYPYDYVASLSNCDSSADSDKLIINSDTEMAKSVSSISGIGLDDHDMCVINNVISSRQAKKNMKAKQKASINQNLLSSCGEGTTLNCESQSSNPESEEKGEKLYKRKYKNTKKSVSSRSVQHDYRSSSSEDVLLADDCIAMKTRSRSSNSTNSESELPPRIRKKRASNCTNEELPSPDNNKSSFNLNSDSFNVNNSCHQTSNSNKSVSERQIKNGSIEELKTPDILQNINISADLSASQNCHQNTKIHDMKDLPGPQPSNCTHASIKSKSPVGGTLDEILSLQQKLFKPQNSSATNEKIISEFKDNFSEQQDTMEEETKEYQQLTNGNVCYSLWRLGKLKLMLRSQVDCQITNTSTPFFLFPKLEFQLLHGVEVTTISELVKQWIALQTCPGSHVLKIRIDSANSNLYMLEELDFAKFMAEKKTFQPSRALHQVSAILNALTELPDGHYLLIHESDGITLSLLKSVESTQHGVIDLHNTLQQRLKVLDDERSDSLSRREVPWLPIDPEIVLTMHMDTKIIPGCFPPKNIPRCFPPKDKRGTQNKRNTQNKRGTQNKKITQGKRGTQNKKIAQDKSGTQNKGNTQDKRGTQNHRTREEHKTKEIHRTREEHKTEEIHRTREEHKNKRNTQDKRETTKQKRNQKTQLTKQKRK